MTLAEILPEATQLPALDTIRLIRFLADDLENAEEAIFPFDPTKYMTCRPHTMSSASQKV